MRVVVDIETTLTEREVRDHVEPALRQASQPFLFKIIGRPTYNTASQRMRLCYDPHCHLMREHLEGECR